MPEAFDAKKFLHALNPFDSVLWAKAAAYGLRIAVALGLFVLVKSYLSKPKITQPITITNPTGPVYLNHPTFRKWVVTGLWWDRGAGATVGAEFGERFSYGIGARYDQELEEWGPLIMGQIRF